MDKKFLVPLALGLFFVVGIAGSYFVYSTYSKNQANDKMMRVYLKTRDGKIVQPDMAGFKPLAVVNDVAEIIELKLDVVVQNDGNVPLKNLRITSGSPQAFEDSLNLADTESLFNVGQEKVWSGEWMDVEQFEGGDTTFAANVAAFYHNAQGVQTPITKSGSVTLNILPDVCSDGTVWDECSPVTKPLYCAGGVLIDYATVCGCPETYEQDPIDPDKCILRACQDGTTVNECTAQLPQYCNDQKMIVDDCAECGCPDDYYGNPAVCEPDGSCLFRDYSGSITVSLDYAEGDPGIGSGCTVAFRTNAENGNYQSGDWVAVDIDGDGNLEGRRYFSTTSDTMSNYESLGIITPEGYPVYTNGDWALVFFDELNGDVYVFGFEEATAVTTTLPTEPYTSNGQEVCG